jgi:hypothetical protein
MLSEMFWEDREKFLRLIVVIGAGIFGIFISSGAVYFLLNYSKSEDIKLNSAQTFGENFKAALKDLVKIRKSSETSPNFSSPKLNKKSDIIQNISSISTSTSGDILESGEENINTEEKLSEDYSARFGKILISEVQILGEKPEDDFIELYNPNDFSVGLDGWSIKKKTSSGKEYVLVSETYFKGKAIAPNGYFLLARTGSNIGVEPDIWWPKSNSISEDNTILLYFKRNKDLILVDAVGFGDAYEFEGNPLPNPGKGETLARKSPNDTDNNAVDFIRAIPSPQNVAFKAGFITPQAAPSPFPAQTPIPSPSPALNPSPTPSPSSSPSPTPTISPQISSGPTPSPTSSPSPSPSPSQSPSPTPSPSSEPTLTPLSPALIIISEILFNPAGSDTGKEFIELFNVGDTDLDLRGWALRLQDINSTSSSSLITFGSKPEDITIIPAHKHFLVGMNNYNVLPVPDAKRSSSLPNSSRTIILINSDGEVIDSVTYDSEIPEGFSWERVSFDVKEFRANPSPSPQNSKE